MADNSNKTTYEMLGIAPTDNFDEIKKAYRGLAKKYHPDKRGDPQDFKDLSTAFDHVNDETKARRYYSYFSSQTTPLTFNTPAPGESNYASSSSAGPSSSGYHQSSGPSDLNRSEKNRFTEPYVFSEPTRPSGFTGRLFGFFSSSSSSLVVSALYDRLLNNNSRSFRLLSGENRTQWETLITTHNQIEELLIEMTRDPKNVQTAFTLLMTTLDVDINKASIPMRVYCLDQLALLAGKEVSKETYNAVLSEYKQIQPLFNEAPRPAP